MKQLTFLSFVSLLLINTEGFSQNITLSKKNTAPEKIIAAIKKQTGFTSWYKCDIFKGVKKMDVSFNNVPFTQALDSFVSGRPFTYEIVSNIIILKPKAPAVSKFNVSTKPEDMVSDGYQQMSKEKSPGSFEKVDRAMLDRNGTGNVLTRLNGINGLTVQTDSKGVMSVMIRGKNSISGGTDPLIVVDGFPFEGDINNINVANIEDVTVLKDASASSIWGSRAGNGVIVITTKKANGQSIKNPADAENTISTKEGMFQFKKTPTETLMNWIGRIYDLEIVYTGKTYEDRYSGALSEKLLSADILKILTASGIQFKIDGKKIVML